MQGGDGSPSRGSPREDKPQTKSQNEGHGRGQWAGRAQDGKTKVRPGDPGMRVLSGSDGRRRAAGATSTLLSRGPGEAKEGAG